MYHFRHIARYWSKFANFFLQHKHLSPLLRETAFNFYRPVLCQKTTVPRFTLARGFNCLMSSAVSVQYRRVTDRQKDKHTDGCSAEHWAISTRRALDMRRAVKTKIFGPIVCTCCLSSGVDLCKLCVHNDAQITLYRLRFCRVACCAPNSGSRTDPGNGDGSPQSPDVWATNHFGDRRLGDRS